MEQSLGPNHYNVTVALNNLAGLSENQARYAEAELLYKRLLAIREKSLGHAHVETAKAVNNLAYLYQRQGRYTDAETFLQESAHSI